MSDSEVVSSGSAVVSDRASAEAIDSVSESDGEKSDAADVVAVVDAAVDDDAVFDAAVDDTAVVDAAVDDVEVEFLLFLDFGTLVS